MKKLLLVFTVAAFLTACNGSTTSTESTTDSTTVVTTPTDSAAVVAPSTDTTITGADTTKLNSDSAK